MSEATILLNAMAQGDDHAKEALWTLVYDQMCRLAGDKISREAPGQTLTAHDLVHEAYMRLVGGEGAHFENSRHFFCAAAEAMRRILIDRARRKHRDKRGGGWERVTLEDVDVSAEDSDETLLFVDEALEELEREDRDCAEMVKLRFFSGHSFEKAGEILGFSEMTAYRNWLYSKAWLRRRLKQESSRAE
jgi:RNA polymerase sigma factor (TIGR02999 family)